MEFQTGGRADQAVGQAAFDQLATMLDRLSRSVHCILVGAGRYYTMARERLRSFTVIDSAPFMHAQARQLLSKDATGKFFWRKLPTREGSSLQALFEANVQQYEKMLSAGPEKMREPTAEDPKQIALLC